MGLKELALEAHKKKMEEIHKENLRYHGYKQSR